jgi:hypothetical protein
LSRRVDEHGTHAVLGRYRRAPALVLLGLVVGSLYLLTATYTVAQNNDSRAAAMGAWSLGTRGTASLPSEWPEEGISWPSLGHDGELRVNRFPGVMYWAAPFYAVNDAVRGGAETPAHPYLLDYRPAAVAAIVAATLAVLATFLVFVRLVDHRTAWFAALFFAIATSTWSISGNALWTHGLTHLFLMLGTLALASERAWLAGAAYGASIFARPHTAIVPLAVGSWRSWHRRDPLDLLRVGLPSALGLAAVVAYSWINFRNPLPTAGYGDYAVANVSDPISWRLPGGVWGTLVDPMRGLLIQAPFLIVLAAGLPAAWRAAPHWVRSAALAGIGYQLLQLQLNVYTGGIFFFSYRLPLEMLVLTSPLLLLSFTETVLGRRVRELAFVIGASVAVGFQLVGVTSMSVETIVGHFLEPAITEVCEQPEYDCTVGELLP